MRKLTILLIVCTFIIMYSMTVYSGEQAPARVKALARNHLVLVRSDPVIVSAVKDANAKKKTLEKIKEIDNKWSNTIGTDDFVNSIMSCSCSQHLDSIKNGNDLYEKIFVMDNLGAIIAMTDKASDYWYGDDIKFIKCYKGGSGEIYISDVDFDDSTQYYLTQVSVPVMDEGKAIGVILFGINVDKVN